MDGIVVAFTGRLGGDPETRYLADGVEVLQFSIAPNDSKAADGHTEWVRVSIYTSKLGEGVTEKLSKGGEAYIEGRLQVGRWEGQDGSQRAGLRVNAWQVVPMAVIGRRRPALRSVGQSSTAMGSPQGAA